MHNNQRRKTPSTSTDETDDDSVSHQTDQASRDPSALDPTPEEGRETSPSSQYSMSDATDESQEDEVNLEVPNVPTEISPAKRAEKDTSRELYQRLHNVVNGQKGPHQRLW